MQTAELFPDCVRFSCCSPLASAPQLLLAACVCASAAAPGPDCGIRFNCCSPFASASSCLSPIAPASSAARRLHPLQLLLPIASTLAATPRLRPLQLLLPDYVSFDCCSPIADSSQCPDPKFSNILRGVRGSVNKLKYEGRASL